MFCNCRRFDYPLILFNFFIWLFHLVIQGSANVGDKGREQRSGWPAAVLVSRLPGGGQADGHRRRPLRLQVCRAEIQKYTEFPEFLQDAQQLQTILFFLLIICMYLQIFLLMLR